MCKGGCRISGFALCCVYCLRDDEYNNTSVMKCICGNILGIGATGRYDELWGDIANVGAAMSDSSEWGDSENPEVSDGPSDTGMSGGSDVSDELEKLEDVDIRKSRN